MSRSPRSPCRSMSERPAAMHRAWRRSTASVETSHLFAAAGDRPSTGRPARAAQQRPGRGRAVHRRRRAVVLHAVRARLAHQQHCSCCRSGRRSRSETLSDPRPPAGDRGRRRGATRSRARSCTSCATGELARAGEIPHTPYYGTVDATPLWLMLLDEYHRWTGDDELVDRLWPNALAAPALDRRVRRHRRRRLRRVRAPVATRPRQPGLEGLGRRDALSATARLAEAPIALVEVQGYVYAAPARHGPPGRAARRATARRSARSRRPSSCASAFEDGVLDGRRRAPTRWRSTATKQQVDGHRLERRPRAVGGHRLARARGQRRATC